MKITLSPRQYHALRGELARERRALDAEKAMDPGDVLSMGLDVENIRTHLEALTRMLGKATVDAIVASGEPITVGVDDCSRTD